MAPGCALSRGTPVCCGAVENFVQDRHLRALQQKVAHSKTSIRNSWTNEEARKLQTSRRNVKREQLQNERFSSIEHENMRLLDKMHEIERRAPPRPPGGKGPPPPACARGGSLPPIGAGSKVGARLREMRRIDEDNLRFLRRLQGAKSSVNLPALEEEHRARQKVMRMRCEIQRPEWREQLPKPLPRYSQSSSPRRAAGEEEDEECRRLLQLQEQIRAKMELEDLSTAPDSENPADLADAAEDEADGSPAVGSSESEPACSSARPTADPQPPPSPARPMLGGVIPATSKVLVESLLAEDDERRAAERLRKEEEESRDAEAAAAKEAAAQALLLARAVDAEAGEALLAYGDMLRHR